MTRHLSRHYPVAAEWRVAFGRFFEDVAELGRELQDDGLPAPERQNFESGSFMIDMDSQARDRHATLFFNADTGDIVLLVGVISKKVDVEDPADATLSLMLVRQYLIGWVRA